MICRLLVTALLAAAVAAPAATRTHAVARDDEAEKITPGEEREARELARQFVERLRETNDVAPLVEDLFVKDLGERLRHDRVGIPMIFVAPEVAKRAAPDELRKFYIAQFNFYSLTFGYWATPVNKPDEEDDDGEVTLEDMYPPEVVLVLKSDPIISAFLAKEEEEAARVERSDAADTGTTEQDASGASARKSPQKEESDESFIKDIAALRTATATSEKAAEALRAHVPPFSVLRRLQEATNPGVDFEEVHAFYLDAPEEDCTYGLPPNARLIRGNVEPAYHIQFHLVMVRVEGRMRILVAYPAFAN